MSELRHGIHEHADGEPVRQGLPETVESATPREKPVLSALPDPAPVAEPRGGPSAGIQSVDLQAAYLAAYPEEEPRERRRLFGRGQDAEDSEPTLSRSERRAQQKAAQAAAKEAEIAAKEVEKRARIEAEEAEKLAAAQARDAEKAAKEAAKRAEAEAREAEKRAQLEAKEAEKRAAVQAKEAEKAAKEAAKRAGAEAKEAKKLAAVRAKEAEKAAKEAAKHAEAEAKESEKRAQLEAKEAEKRAAVQAKEAEKAAKEAAKRAEAEAKESEKRARAQAREDERAAKEAAKAAEERRRQAEQAAKARAKEEEEVAKAEREAAEKIARARAEEQERAAKEAAKAAEAQRKQSEQAAKAQARENEKAAREEEKLAAAQAKEAEKRAAAQAEETERAAKEAEKLAAAQARKAADLAKAQTTEAEPSSTEPPRAEKEPRRQKPRRERKAKAEKGKSGKGVKKLVGLKIGASQIAVARVSNNGAPELVEAVREPLEPGLVVSGEVRDPDALAAALKRFFDTHKLPKKGIRLGISNNRIGVRVFEIEGVADASQLENAVRFRAEEVLPIPLEQAVLDYVVLGEEQREDGTHVHRILLVVAYRDAVDRYLQACRGAGLEIVGVDLEAFALLRALSAPTDEFPGGGALIAVTIGHDRTTIAVSTGRYCDFTRVLDWGGWSLNVVIARALDVAPSEVEGTKRQLSLRDEKPVEGLTPEQLAKVREAVRGALGSFARELVASLQFYQAQPGALGIGEIQLTGGAAHFPGLPEELSRIIGVPVRVGDPLRRMMVANDVGHIDQIGSFAVAIGLGIED